MILALAAFTQLAASCGPTVDVETLAAVAKTESGFDTNAIRDDTTGQAYHPTNAEAARRLAHELVTITGHSVDLGLMQVNSGNLHILGMSVADAVDPCKSIAAGARVLTAAYEPPPPDTDPQPALLRALSRYNTGRRLRGFANGYVQKIEAAAQQIVPAIRVGAVAPGREGGEGREAPPQPQSPPSWDVYGQALYAREHGGIVFGGTSPVRGAPATSAANPQPAAQPDRYR